MQDTSVRCYKHEIVVVFFDVINDFKNSLLILMFDNIEILK